MRMTHGLAWKRSFAGTRPLGYRAPRCFSTVDSGSSPKGCAGALPAPYAWACWPPWWASGRLALLGWLLAQVFAGAPAESLILPVALVAVVMGLRGVLEYWRNMIAHRTAARVQLALRLLEVATGLGGLAIVVTGARLVAAGELAAGTLPLLTLLAMAAFLPVSEIAHIGRQLADTLGATRRLYAVHNEKVAVADGLGVALPVVRGGASLDFSDVDFSYFSNRRLALEDASFSAPAGSTVALVGIFRRR